MKKDTFGREKGTLISNFSRKKVDFVETMENSLQSEELEGENIMLDHDQRYRIRRLYENGLSVTQIAAEEGVNRKTVYRTLAEKVEETPAHLSRQKLLDSYEEELKAWIAKGLSAAWMYRKLQKAPYHYDGSYETIKGYVASRRVRPPKEATVRFETDPADQAQSDWLVYHYKDATGVNRKAYCFSLILAYSRFLYVEFTTRSDQKTLIACHERAFRAFGGIPNEVLFDRQSPVYVRQKGKEIVLNPTFADYARNRHFEPVLCKARRGQTKGKVERPFRYIREDFMLPNDYVDPTTLQTLVPIWLAESNCRIHRTTHELPFERLKKEQPLLQPIVDNPFVGDWTSSRRVTREAMISYLGSSYSVPWKNIDHQVKVWDEDGTVCIQVDNRVIRHELATQRGEVHRNPEHFEGLTYPVRKTTLGTKREFRERFPASGLFIAGVERDRIGNVRYHLQEVMSLVSLYSETIVAEAIHRVAASHDFSCGAVRKLCEDGYVDGPAHCPSPVNIPYGPRPDRGIVDQRSLAFYEEIAVQEGRCKH